MQIGEHGIILQGDAQYDISNMTSLLFRFFKPDEALSTFTATAVLETAATTTVDGAVLAADKWASYVFNSGDLDVAGNWGVQLEFEDSVAVIKLKSPRATFFVSN